LGNEEEEGDDDPGFEGAMEIRGCVAQDKETDNDEEVDD
jgi:hypothetical protein